MWGWIQILIIIITVWIVIEEGIYFFTNRCLFGPSNIEKKLRERFFSVKKVFKKEAS
ncbi:hypothetical protein [Cytobacillus depressus]|uniref:hypothetical protein n=1 Tax=Cytobacillus depressus TaxID=1602942 RepID=UPI001478A96B|nr:hypothetical protein [Cytobacillus depressus]